MMRAIRAQERSALQIFR